MELILDIETNLDETIGKLERLEELTNSIADDLEKIEEKAELIRVEKVGDISTIDIKTSTSVVPEAIKEEIDKYFREVNPEVGERR